MAEPELPDRIGPVVAWSEVVQEERAARSEQAEELLVVLRPAPVGEEEVERRLSREHVPPVALQYGRVRIRREQLGRFGCTSRIELDRNEGDVGIEGGEDPRRADAAAA